MRRQPLFEIQLLQFGRLQQPLHWWMYPVCELSHHQMHATQLQLQYVCIQMRGQLQEIPITPAHLCSLVNAQEQTVLTKRIRGQLVTVGTSRLAVAPVGQDYGNLIFRPLVMVGTKLMTSQTVIPESISRWL